jgi:hypothetical protein
MFIISQHAAAVKRFISFDIAADFVISEVILEWYMRLNWKNSRKVEVKRGNVV